MFNIGSYLFKIVTCRTHKNSRTSPNRHTLSSPKRNDILFKKLIDIFFYYITFVKKLKDIC